MCAFVYVCTCMCMYVRVCLCMFVYVRVHESDCELENVCICVGPPEDEMADEKNIDVFAMGIDSQFMHARTYTHTHMHMHTRTQTIPLFSSRSLSLSLSLSFSLFLFFSLSPFSPFLFFLLSFFPFPFLSHTLVSSKSQMSESCHTYE